MKHLFLSILFLFSLSTAFGQNTFSAALKDSETNEPLIGASVLIEGTTNGGSTDANGEIVIQNIPNGKQVIAFSFVGYQTLKVTYIFPLPTAEPVAVFLESDEEELEEIVIASTRSTRTIENIPTRVEFIAGEELEEKGNMKPGDIRMLLNESTGIQTQQTSATSYNSSIRIQGLDGKYTQILRDGLPLYSGFSGGLSLLQIAPLDLQQVEVIKGASSTLYGGGAIAGLVNLISKTPEEERNLSFMLNGTSALGLDASGFYSEKFGKIGTTVFASYHLGTPYDPADIGLTAIPKFNRYTLNPRLFFYIDEKTTLNIGLNNTVESRTGGDLNYAKGERGNPNAYFEQNETNRLSSQIGLERAIGERAKFTFKNSLNYYDRDIQVPNYQFSGTQFASFSEVNYQFANDQWEWIGGANLWTDRFSQNPTANTQVVDYQYTTIGLFLQNTFNATEKLAIETGLRGDYQSAYGFFLLPRVSVLFLANEHFTARLGGGMGYNAPTVFTEDAERVQFRQVLPIDVSNTEAERSIGGNFDLNYQASLSDELSFTLNTLFFYTRVQDPLTFVRRADDLYQFQQPDGAIYTQGIEANLKVDYGNFKLFIGYTLADVTQERNGQQSTFPLVARHRLNNVLMYEIEEKLKIGLEAYYFGPQQLNDGSTGQSYWINGLMVEKIWERFSVFINFENFLDTRQTRFDTIYTGNLSNPIFRDIYAPVDGFVINGGFKLRL